LLTPLKPIIISRDSKMLKYLLSIFMLASILGLTACGGEDNRSSSATAPANQTVAIFSPATGEFPIPNDLLFAAQDPSDGTMNAGEDPENPVISGIDALDGNSVLAPFDIVFSGSLDTSQNLDAANFVQVGDSVVPNPNQNVFLLPLAYPSGDGLSQASITMDIGGETVDVSVEVPTFAEALGYLTATADPMNPDLATLGKLATPTVRAEIISLDGGTDNILRINPLHPLMPKTKYLVVITNVQDTNGNPVASSSSYDVIKDPTTDFASFGPSGAGLAPIQPAIQGWERLAGGYFSFMQGVFDAAGISATAPSAEDIIFSITFTTGGTTDVLQYIAAPEYFFTESLSSGYKKDAIAKLVSGQYNVDGTTTINDSPSDTEIAATINFLLTNQELAPDVPNALYNPSIAEAVNAGAPYSVIAEDASAAYLMQRAAAEAATSVNDGDGITIAQEAVGTVQAIVDGVSAQAGVALATSDVFPVPADRPTNFYRVDMASEISQLLQAPAQIYQGEITLPYYQKEPTETDPLPVKTSAWEADPVIGGAIDLGRGNEAGTTPPTDMITYRYPFPSKQSDATIPIMVTTPDATTLSAFGVTKPDAGWPVIIFVHGITGERTLSLPMANALAFACIATNAEGSPTGAIPGTQCFATVAIDQPLHGIAATGSLVPGFDGTLDPGASAIPMGSTVGDNIPSEELIERHFNLAADAAANPIPMDYENGVGSSGGLFINLTNFTNARDNLRQMSVDLLNVAASLDSMDLNDDGTADDLDPDNVYFIGHSLGAIDGLPFVAINNSAATQTSIFSSQPLVKAAAALNTGGGSVRLLTNSTSFAPSILGGLAAASDSLVQGNSGLESYLSVFQGVLDSGDVMNFAGSFKKSSADTGLLLTEIVGSDTTPADLTIPNSADDIYPFGTGPLNLTVPETGFVINGFPAPLAGTEPLIAQAGAIATSGVSEEADADRDVVVTRFSDGTHGTPASADNLPVFLEMVSQIFTFFTAEGDVTGSIVTNSDVVAE